MLDNGDKTWSNTEQPQLLPARCKLAEHHKMELEVEDAWVKLRAATEAGNKVRLGNVEFHTGSWELCSSEYIRHFFRATDADLDSDWDSSSDEEASKEPGLGVSALAPAAVHSLKHNVVLTSESLADDSSSDDFSDTSSPEDEVQKTEKLRCAV